ncbi:GNAT family N-acetyltransferase [Thermoflavifilum thermophilum]|nr:GNAT family N-acetyltransferase [Thermoflavifilum thermophilum]
MHSIQFICRDFTALSPTQLYAIWQLRNRVFIVEQQCAYLDADDKDQQAYHLMGFSISSHQLLIYTRLLPPGVGFQEMAIGRVVVHPDYRNMGLGKLLMQKSIEAIQVLYGPGPIRLGAQLYLQKFYESFGFQVCSDVYLEDGIPHVEMIWNPAS